MNVTEQERKRDFKLGNNFRLPIQERTQQPTLPQCIRVMEWERGREGDRTAMCVDPSVWWEGGRLRDNGEVTGGGHRRRGFMLHERKPIDWLLLRLHDVSLSLCSTFPATHRRAGASIPPSRLQFYSQRLLLAAKIKVLLFIQHVDLLTKFYKYWFLICLLLLPFLYDQKIGFPFIHLAAILVMSADS